MSFELMAHVGTAPVDAGVAVTMDVKLFFVGQLPQFAKNGVSVVIRDGWGHVEGETIGVESANAAR